MTTTLLDLDENVLLLILFYASAEDVLSARKVCSNLFRASKAKTLWLHVLRNAISTQNLVLPPYAQTPESLSSGTIEAIFLRLTRFHTICTQKRIRPNKITELHLPQSVDWLKLVNGRWLIVASSDQFVSKLSCWDLFSTTSRSSGAMTECFLPGRVLSGKVEIQTEGMILAISVGPYSPCVFVFALSRLEGGVVFEELRRLPGFSHIQLLSGDFLACGLRDDVSIPHLIDWKTSAEYPLAAVPPSQGSVLAFNIWSNYLIAFNVRTVDIFCLPTCDSAPLTPVQIIDLGLRNNLCLLEVVEIRDHPKHSTSSDASLSEVDMAFIAFARNFVYGFVLKAASLAGSSTRHEFKLLTTRLTNIPNFDDGGDWYNLATGSSGRRLIWISAADDSQDIDEDYINHAFLSTNPWKFDRDGSFSNRCFEDRLLLAAASSVASLSAFPVIDFDDTLGLVVIGNIFGELVVIDYVGLGSPDIWSISQDIFSHDAKADQVAPLKPISLDLPECISRHPGSLLAPPPPFSSAIEPWSSGIATMDTLPSGYSNDWPAWEEWLQWQGLPGDQAWLIEHAYGYLGRPKPLAYSSWKLYFQAGGLYFLLDCYESDYEMLNCYDASVQWSGIVDGSAAPAHRTFGRRSANYQAGDYGSLLAREMSRHDRNRWIEQKGRGGRPPAQLLVTREEHERQLLG